MAGGVIALFEFNEDNDEITVARERHYELVQPDRLTTIELAAYRTAAERISR